MQDHRREKPRNHVRGEMTKSAVRRNMWMTLASRSLVFFFFVLIWRKQTLSRYWGVRWDTVATRKKKYICKHPVGANLQKYRTVPQMGAFYIPRLSYGLYIWRFCAHYAVLTKGKKGGELFIGGFNVPDSSPITSDKMSWWSKWKAHLRCSYLRCLQETQCDLLTGSLWVQLTLMIAGYAHRKKESSALWCETLCITRLKTPNIEQLRV